MSHETRVIPPKAVLVGVPVQGVSDQDNEESLQELSRLVKTLGYDVIHKLSQRRRTLGGGTILGEGKLAELAKLTGGKGIVEKGAFRKKTKAAAKQEKTEEEDEDDVEDFEEEPDLSNLPTELANLVVFDCELSPSQLANVKSATGADVLDRTGVIVDIFARHAKSKVAKLQVEMARLSYQAPRIRAVGGGGDRMNTAGESSIELDRRKIRDRIAELKKELVQLQEQETTKRGRRTDELCVALVGYTNAGKSSLMRALTGSEVLVADKLFATLDTTVRIMQPPTTPKVLVSDTVGFIKKLPHDLVASFRSTLDEAAGASLLLFVVDASDPTFRSQLEVTREVLASIGTENIPSRLLLNKIDLLTVLELGTLLSEFPDAIALSTKDPDSVASLRSLIMAFFEQGMKEEEIFVAYSRQGAVGKIRSSVRVLSERCEADGIYYLVRGSEQDIARLKAL